MTQHLRRSITTVYSDETISPEQKLWRACIEQHLRDAVFDYESFLNGSREKKTIRVVTNRGIYAVIARAWFEKADASFEFVCDMAGFEPSVIRKLALEIIEDFKACVTVKRKAATKYTPANQRSKTYDYAGNMDARDREGMVEGSSIDGAVISASQGHGIERILAGSGSRCE